MNICLITEHFPPHIGGVEKVFEEYAQQLAALGHSIRVVTSNSGGMSGEQALSPNIRVYFTPCSSKFGHPLLSSRALFPHIQWADVVHTTTYTAALPALHVSKKLQKPCILMVHEVLSQDWFLIEKNPLKALAFLLFEKYVITRKYTAWHAISLATKKALLQQGIPEEHVFLIYHGIDEKIWNPLVSPKNLTKLFQLDPTDKVFLYNGRPGKTKGILTLLDAIRVVDSQLPAHFKFGFILPKNPTKERRAFIAKVAAYHLTDRVKISTALPYRELPGYRKAAYCFIVPSLTEGFGFNAAETAALEVPLIVSDAGSLPEVVDGKALFFKRGNVSDLAKKILLSSQGNFDIYPEKKFSWQKAAQEVETLYKQVV